MTLPNFSFILFLFLPFSFGCIHLEQEIRIKDASSGTFKTRLAIPLNLYRSFLEADEVRNSDSLMNIFDPKLGSQSYSEINGVKLLQYRAYERGDKLNVLIEGEILDIQSVCDSKILGECKLSQIKDGISSLEFASFSPLISSLPSNPENELSKTEQLKKVVKGMRLSLIIQVPDTVVETSASIVKDNLVQWIYDPEVDDSFLSTPPKLFVKFKHSRPKK